MGCVATLLIIEVLVVLMGIVFNPIVPVDLRNWGIAYDVVSSAALIAVAARAWENRQEEDTKDD